MGPSPYEEAYSVVFLWEERLGHRRHMGVMRERGHCEKAREKPKLLAPWSWTFSLWNHEKINFCCWRHPVCGMVMAAPQTNTGEWMNVASLKQVRANPEGRTTLDITLLQLITMITTQSKIFNSFFTPNLWSRWSKYKITFYYSRYHTSWESGCDKCINWNAPYTIFSKGQFSNT